MKNTLRNATLLSLAVLTGGCVSVQTPSPADPWEGLNRQVFQFNDGVDQAILKPTAQAYKWTLPQPMRDSVTNFFSNIGDVGNMANNLLQAKGTAAAEDFMRIAINSVFGIGGLFDFATPAGLPKHPQDFGRTLGVWGVPPGPYLVLPIFGPSTVRDAAGIVAEVQMSPTTYINTVWVRNTLYGVATVNTRANLLGATSLLSQAALDKYSFTRDAYLQRRNYLIHGDSADNLPNYGDDGGTAASPESSAPSVPSAPQSGQQKSGDGGSNSGENGATGTGISPAPAVQMSPKLVPFRR